MPIRKEVLDELLEGYEKLDDLLGESGILKKEERGCPSTHRIIEHSLSKK